MAAVKRPTIENGQPVRAFAAWGTLAIFIVLYLLSIFDRQILSLLLVPIQQDLGLSDLQLGMVHGLAFSLLYAFFGLALGWAVDSYSKKWLLFGGVLVWTFATISCGLANTFSSLFLARLFVGVGEAVVGPAAFSVLTRIFPKHRLGLVLGMYYAASNLGSALIFIGGGALIGSLNETGGLALPFVGMLKPWQAAFCLIAAPGLMLAFLSFLIVDPKPSATAIRQPFAQGIAEIRVFFALRGKLFAIHVAAFTLLCMNAYAAMSWAPTYIIRTFHWSPVQVGLTIGISNGLFGIVGNMFWGSMADRLARKGHGDATYRTYRVAVLLGLPIAVATFLVSDPKLMVVLMCLMWLIGMSSGAFAAALGMFVPAAIRGRISALQAVAVALFAIGGTPVFVGGLTDHVYGSRDMVGHSIATVIFVCSILALLLIQIGMRPLREAAQNHERDFGA